MLTNTKAFSGFSVDDLSKAKAFYGQTLGLEFIEEAMGLLTLHINGNNPITVYTKPNHTPATLLFLISR